MGSDHSLEMAWVGLYKTARYLHIIPQTNRHGSKGQVIFTVKVLLEEMYILVACDGEATLSLRVVDCGDGAGEIIGGGYHAWLACNLRNIVVVNARIRVT